MVSLTLLSVLSYTFLDNTFDNKYMFYYAVFCVFLFCPENEKSLEITEFSVTSKLFSFGTR